MVAEREIIFVYGALRSGTTLLKLVLNMHSDIDNPGEFDFLTDCLRQDPAGEWRVDRDRLFDLRIFLDSGLTVRDDLDGLPLMRDLLAQIQAKGEAPITIVNLHRNAWAIDLIHPGARIIHALRDPRDVARSSIGMGWCGFAYFGIDHWLQTERQWSAWVSKISADRFIELRYETLVKDPVTTLAGLCAFIGVPYEPDMLRFHEKSTYEPIDGVLAEQWRKKAPKWEIQQIEFKLGAMLDQSGYAASGGPIPEIGRMGHMSLWVRNKIATIRRSVETYGGWLYVQLKIRQALGPKTWLRNAWMKKLEIDRQHLR